MSWWSICGSESFLTNSQALSFSHRPWTTKKSLHTYLHAEFAILGVNQKSQTVANRGLAWQTSGSARRRLFAHTPIEQPLLYIFLTKPQRVCWRSGLVVGPICPNQGSSGRQILSWVLLYFFLRIMIWKQNVASFLGSTNRALAKGSPRIIIVAPGIVLRNTAFVRIHRPYNWTTHSQPLLTEWFPRWVIYSWQGLQSLASEFSYTQKKKRKRHSL